MNINVLLIQLKALAYEKRLQVESCIINNQVSAMIGNSPISRVFALPVYIWRKFLVLFCIASF